jgi:cation-transporting ATPase I
MRRPAWTRGDQAHIQVNGPVEPAAARRLEQALQAVDGVRWAAYNGVLDRVVVSFDRARSDRARLAGVVDGALGPYRPGDLDRCVADAIALGADVLAAAGGLVGRALRVAPLPGEVTALPAAASLVPRLTERVGNVLGPVRTDLLGALAGSALAAAAHTPLTPLADAALRALRIGENRAARRAWARAAPRLYADASRARAAAPLPPRPPSALPDGPIERYAARATTMTLLAAAALLPTGLRRSARAVAVGAPRAAYHGREAFAAHVGRLLAQRGVVVCDHGALRRLDRLDTVILDAGALTTGRALVAEVLGVPGTDETEAKTQALAMLDANAPRRVVRRGPWVLGPLSRLGVDLPGELDDAIRRTPRGRREALGLVRSGRLVAAVTVEAQLDPLAPAVVAAARKVGRVLVAGTGSGLAERLRADGAIAGGSRLAASVRGAQRRGAGVVLVSAGNDPALAAADCGIGVLRRDRRPPWGAHLMGGPGLEAAWLALEATALARRVSGRSAKVAALGSAAGALLLLTGSDAAAGRQAVVPVGAASLANAIGGAWSAATLGRRGVPVPESDVPWHAMSPGDVLSKLDTSVSGLPDSEVEHRRGQATDGPGAPNLLRVIVEEMNNPLTAPLAAGAAVSMATGGLTDAALISGVQAATASLGGVQRLAATRALRELLAASSTRVRLRRGGASRDVPAEELVSGDIVTLRAGDAVPADCRLLEAAGLEMDESNLTGESLPVSKSPAPTVAPAVADRTSMVYAGTTVAAGGATAVVVATGRRTEAGRSAEVTTDREPAGGVEARLHRLTALSLPVAGGAAVAMLAGGLLRGRPGPALATAVGLAVAAVPEGLPFVATVAQLSTARRLSRRNVLVRNPRTVESLGRLDVVCFDKTGTLTEGRIRLGGVSDGRATEPAGALTGDRRLVLAAALRASPVATADQSLPHPTDRAVVAGGEAAGIAIDEGAAGWRVIRELPFEPGRGFHAVLGETPEGHTISVKGAPDTVLPRCVAWRRSDASGGVRPLTKANRRRLEAEVDELAAQGVRVLAVAERPASRRRRLDDDRVERLEFRGLLGLADPVRPTAAEAVDRLRRAGIDAVMLTGDHPGTAEAIAEELGILGGRGVVTGPSLDGLDDAELVGLVSGTTVFARVSPAHKVAIVRALRRAGRVVAVTGDGANDAPAIRLADVGIALGDPGTAAAREAADMIVTDDRIETIVSAVVDGRAMWVSVRDAVALLLGGNLGEIAFTLGTGLLSPEAALNARQLLLVNLVTDLLPAIALATRPPTHVSPEDLLREGPDRSLGAALTRDIARRAVATWLAASVGWVAGRMTGTRRRASTVGLASLVGAQLAQTAVASRGDPAVLAAAALSALALVGTVQFPVTSRFFGCRPLGPLAWTIVAGASGVGAVVGAVPLPAPPAGAPAAGPARVARRR